MSVIRFLDKVQDSGLYQAFITKLSPLLTEPQFTKYLTPVYNETKDWKGIEAYIGRIPMASLIDEHSGSPIVGTLKPAEIRGRLPMFGNTVPFSSDELDEISKLEAFIEQNVARGNQALADQLTDQLTDLLVNRYIDMLAGMPLTTIDKLFFEMWSNGTETILAADNLAGLSYQIDWEVKKYHVGTVWSDAANATGLADLDKFCYRIWKDLNFKPDTLALNSDEIRKLLAQASTKSAITSYISSGGMQTKVAGIASLDNVNMVLMGQYRLPSITEIDFPIDILDENGIDVKQTMNGFIDGRVSATLGTQLGAYMYTLDAEQKRPDKEYTYATAANNVLLASISKKGNLTMESKLNALPVLTVRKRMAILVTDDTTTGSALA